MNNGFDIVVTLVAVLGVMLVGLVLLQRGRGRGGGVSNVLGATGSQSAFGRRTGDVMTWATVATFALFITFAAAASRLAH